MPRERLPDTREGINRRFTVIWTPISEDGTPKETVEVKGYLHANTYPDGRLAEIFIRIGKAGSTFGWLDSWATACSIALQRGATVNEIFEKSAYQDFPPYGKVRWMDDIKSCKSLPDLISRFLLARFGTKEQAA